MGIIKGRKKLLIYKIMSFVIEKAENFKYIHRILNTNIDGKRRVPFAIRGIKGIGRRFAALICKVLRIDTSKRCGELSEAEASKIVEVINDPISYGIPVWCLNR